MHVRFLLRSVMLNLKVFGNRVFHRLLVVLVVAHPIIFPLEGNKSSLEINFPGSGRFCDVD